MGQEDEESRSSNRQDLHRKDISRRDFLKITTLSAAFGTASALGASNIIKQTDKYRHLTSTDTSITGMQTGNNSDLLIHENFEDSSWTSHWTDSYGPENASTDTSYSVSGNSSLRVSYQRGDHYGLDKTYQPEKAGKGSFKEMYMEYWVRYEEGFDPSGLGGGWGGPKLPGMIYEVDGHSAGTGTDGESWSTMPNLQPSGDWAQYTYHLDMDSGYGDHFTFMSNVPTGEWIKIGQYVKMNTVSNGTANRDGLLQVWVNDEKKLDREMRWTENPENGIWPQLLCYFGGDNPSPKDQVLHIDDWKIARKPISSDENNDSEEPSGTGGIPEETDSWTSITITDNSGGEPKNYVIEADELRNIQGSNVLGNTATGILNGGTHTLEYRGRLYDFRSQGGIKIEIDGKEPSKAQLMNLLCEK